MLIFFCSVPFFMARSAPEQTYGLGALPGTSSIQHNTIILQEHLLSPTLSNMKLLNTQMWLPLI